MRPPPTCIVLLVLLSTSLFSIERVCAFIPKLGALSSFSLTKKKTFRLYFRHMDSTASVIGQNATDAVMAFKRHKHKEPPKSFPQYHRRRELLKRQLAAVAIENYQECQSWGTSETTDGRTFSSRATTSRKTAEDIMRQLEDYCPVARPVHEPDLLNARWSFCFTGVPTIGMKLITLLSRLSTALRPIEFHNVYLDVYNQQSRAKAVVKFAILGLPMELNVFTALAPREPTDEGDDDGTHLWETFQSIALNGVELPTPPSWQKSRDLEIRYIDQDFMIARTAGGEPHLLLRHSPCGTDSSFGALQEEEECDIDADLTEYFAAAQSQYGGQGLARSLVDRAYTVHAPVEAAASIPQIVQSILSGDNNSH